MFVVMESFRDSNANSTTDSFLLYERYLRSFKLVDSVAEENRTEAEVQFDLEESCEGNIDLSVNKHYEITEGVRNVTEEALDKLANTLDTDLCGKVEDTNLSSPAASLLGNSSVTGTTGDHSLLTEKSDHTDVPVTSEDSKSSGFKQPIFITSTMENSNNAVDGVRMFRNTRPSESVFKLPISELSFNGTLKHVQKLKPIVDPISALTLGSNLVNLEEKSEEAFESFEKHQESMTESNSNNAIDSDQKLSSEKADSSNQSSDNRIERNESTGDSQYEEYSDRRQQMVSNEEVSAKWNSEQSYSSLEASFDSGVRSPDVFSDEDGDAPPIAPFWGFIKEFEAYDKRRVRKLEERLEGVLPPPSVTTLKIDVNDMLKKYYCFLPLFADSNTEPEANTSTPSKRVSFVHIPEEPKDTEEEDKSVDIEKVKEEVKLDLDNSVANKSIELKMCSEIEAKETSWPDVLKCRHYDVYYNLTQYSEKYEMLRLRFGERYIGAETDSSVNIHSGGCQSPSSASKRKAMRLKMAQGKSPGRRLSHLARRRQTFCSAATIAEKASTSSKMVLIDKKKLINCSERKSPRLRQTPGKRTPIRRTPGKKTPSKTPKSSSTKKKAMRRLLMDPENMTRSQPREIKRALFISPENRKVPPPVVSTSVPNQVIKSRRALFGSPVTADTKSMDGTQSDQFLKRKRDLMDDSDNGRSKIAKSLSFGGDTITTSSSSSQPHSFNRRASEAFATRNSVEMDETRKKKLLWAVSEALRVHGWRMSSPGFREKASALARLTRRLLSLPPHAARLAAPKASTSETMLRLARQYVFAIIQGRTVEDCYAEEQMKIANDTSNKVTGYISASAYQQMKAKQTSTFVPFASQVKENYAGTIKQEPPRSNSKNILQDKLVNIDANSNSSSGLSMIDKVPLFKSNSMPSFEEAAKMRARRQISFDNVEFPKR